MRIVVLASRKGGSGKTTLAGHLAVQAELSGAGPVALYQISMIIAHFTAVSCSLARRGGRRGVSHHKAPATRRASKRPWPSVGRSGPSEGVAALAPWTYALGSSIALRTAPTRRAAAPHEMGDYHRDLVLVDSDPQGSLADWWNLRAAAAPNFVQAGLDELPDAIERLRAHGMALLVIDTPAALTTRVANLIGLADLVVIPTRPSPHDLRSIGTTVRLVTHLGKPLIFVMNAAPPRARITSEAIALVSQHGPLAPAIVHQRVDFASSMIDGRTVMELPGASRSASEIAQLWTYLESRLERQPQYTGMPMVPGFAAPATPLSAFGATGA